MKKILAAVTALCLASCDDNYSRSNQKNTQPETTRIELTCTPEITGGSQSYISIDTATKTVIDNGAKSEKVLIEEGRIVYETTNEIKKYTVRIDRTSGKMAVKGPNQDDLQLNYTCESVKQKF